MAEKNKNWKVEIKSEKDSTIAINGEISWEMLSGFKSLAIENIKKDMEVDGFRKGQAPDDVVEAKAGEMAVLGEAANLALAQAYPEIVKENKIHVIGQPAISVTKLASNNPLEFVINVTVMPEIKIGDYKTIAKEKNGEKIDVKIDEKEFEAAIDRIRSMSVDHSEHDHKEGEDCKEELPELTLEMVQKFGEFSSIEEFKEMMRKQMTAQKEEENLVSRREALLKEIIEKSEFEVPELLVEVELDKMFAQMKDDIEKMGLKYEDYLKHVGKEEQALRDEWKDEAKTRAQSELILKEIAKLEEIKADQEKLQEQVDKTKESHPDVPEQNIRLFIESNMINQEVLGFLDKQ